MTFKGPRRRKLAQLVSHHVLRDVHRDELLAVVHGQRVPDEIRNDGGPPRLGPNNLLFVPVVHARHLLIQVVIRKGPFF